MDAEEIIKSLEGESEARLSAVKHIGTSHVMKFIASRRNLNGDLQEVAIEVEDHGSRGLVRYMCAAKTNDYREAYGNGGKSPDQAIKVLHWRDLD